MPMHDFPFKYGVVTPRHTTHKALGALCKVCGMMLCDKDLDGDDRAMCPRCGYHATPRRTDDA